MPVVNLKRQNNTHPVRTVAEPCQPPQEPTRQTGQPDQTRTLVPLPLPLPLSPCLSPLSSPPSLCHLSLLPCSLPLALPWPCCHHFASFLFPFPFPSLRALFGSALSVRCVRCVARSSCCVCLAEQTRRKKPGVLLPATLTLACFGPVLLRLLEAGCVRYAVGVWAIVRWVCSCPWCYRWRVIARARNRPSACHGCGVG